MYFSDRWSFVVEIEDDTNKSLGVVPVDLHFESDDWYRWEIKEVEVPE
jgi:hypothetical protein